MASAIHSFKKMVPVKRIARIVLVCSVFACSALQSTWVLAQAELSAIVFRFTQNSFGLQLFLSEDVTFEHERLAFDAKNQLAARFFVDLKLTQTADYFTIPPLQNNPWVQQIRMGRHPGDTIRLVLDLTSQGEKNNITVMKNKKGLVIVSKSKDLPAPKIQVRMPQPKTQTLPGIRKNVLKSREPKYRIVLDAGHGGADPGARGLAGALEKNVVLSMTQKVRALLKQDAQVLTFMTRDKDQTLKLLERTRFANAKKGDLFVSIHANASPRRAAKGVSTYFLNNADDQESLRVAMRENGELDPDTLQLPKGSDDFYLEMMKASMIKNFHTTQSTDLARAVQGSLVSRLQAGFSGVMNLGVRSARFYVLTGAEMPAILVETSFISNPQEEKRLINPSYQNEIASAIVQGIQAYRLAEEKQKNKL